jgi:hypothetical protein
VKANIAFCIRSSVHLYCKYPLGTIIDQSGDNTTEIKHRISQTRKAINTIYSIFWHKNITKNSKSYTRWFKYDRD